LICRHLRPGESWRRNCKVLPVKVLSIFLIVSIYIGAATNRLPDSDYESYLDFFNSGEALSGCYFEFGFCYFVSLANYLGFNAGVAYGGVYGGLLFLVILKYSRNLKTPFDLFIGLIVMLLYLIYISDYYMAFHLYRQNFATILFAFLALSYPITGFFIAGIFHSSIILLFPIFFLIRRIDFGKRNAGFWFLVTCSFIYILSSNLEFFLDYLVLLNFNFFTTRIQIYNDYVSIGSINVIPLFVYLFIVFFIARSRYSAESPNFIFIFYVFVSAILMACFTSFNELISYRFLQVSKGLSLPLLLLSLPCFVRSQLARFHLQ
jgi:hypothetical protein